MNSNQIKSNQSWTSIKCSDSWLVVDSTVYFSWRSSKSDDWWTSEWVVQCISAWVFSVQSIK